MKTNIKDIIDDSKQKRSGTAPGNSDYQEVKTPDSSAQMIGLNKKINKRQSSLIEAGKVLSSQESPRVTERSAEKNDLQGNSPLKKLNS